MQRLCDDCEGVFKNKQSLNAHQNRTGHKQRNIAKTEDSNIAIEQAERDDGELKPNEAIAELNEDVEDLYKLFNDSAEYVEKNNDNIANLTNRYNTLKLSVDSFTNALNGLSNWSETQWKNALNVIATVDIANSKKLSKLHICPDCGAPLHLHRVGEHINKLTGETIWSGDSWHLECIQCGYCTTDYKYPKWKEQKNLFNPQPEEKELKA